MPPSVPRIEPRPGLVVEDTFEGRTFRFKPVGVLRFIPAAFLSLWLCGWTAGEAVVLGILGSGAWAFFTGQPAWKGQSLEPSPELLLITLFLLVWITFWTFGGIAAWTHLLRLVAGQDVLVARPDGLRWTRRAGPFRKTREISRSELRRLYAGRRGAVLMAELTSGPVELTSLARVEELDPLIDELSATLKLDRQAVLGPELPRSWSEEVTREGSRVLVHDLKGRRRKAWIIGFIAALLSASALYLLASPRMSLSTFPATAMVVTAAALVTYSWIRLAYGRTEWECGPGHLQEFRRFLGKRTPRFAAQGIRLSVTTDSDGDAWYSLQAIADPAAPTEGWSHRGNSRVLSKAMNDLTEPRNLGNWIAHVTGWRLEDATEPEEDRATREATLAKLEQSGKLGQWLAGRMRRPR